MCLVQGLVENAVGEDLPKSVRFKNRPHPVVAPNEVSGVELDALQIFSRVGRWAVSVSSRKWGSAMGIGSKGVL